MDVIGALVDERKYPIEQLALIFGVSKDMIYRLYARKMLVVPNTLTNIILELDLDSLPSPESLEFAMNKYNKLLHDDKMPIVVTRKDLGGFDLRDTDPNHHIRYWFEMGFSTRDISQIIGVTAGDVGRALNGTDVSVYAQQQIVASFQAFEPYLIDS